MRSWAMIMPIHFAPHGQGQVLPYYATANNNGAIPCARSLASAICCTHFDTQRVQMLACTSKTLTTGRKYPFTAVKYRRRRRSCCPIRVSGQRSSTSCWAPSRDRRAPRRHGRDPPASSGACSREPCAPSACPSSDFAMRASGLAAPRGSPRERRRARGCA